MPDTLYLDNQTSISKNKVRETSVRHVTPVDGNVFLDLGFPPDEAERLLAEARRRVQQKDRLKRSMMQAVTTWMAEKNLTQAEAADILGIDGVRVSDLVNEEMGKFTLESLADLLCRTGKQISFQIAEAASDDQLGTSIDRYGK